MLPAFFYRQIRLFHQVVRRNVKLAGEFGIHTGTTAFKTAASTYKRHTRRINST